MFAFSVGVTNGEKKDILRCHEIKTTSAVLPQWLVTHWCKSDQGDHFGNNCKSTFLFYCINKYIIVNPH